MSTKKLAILIGSLLLAFAATQAKAVTINLTCDNEQCTATLAGGKGPDSVQPNLTYVNWTGKNAGATQTSYSANKSTATYTCDNEHHSPRATKGDYSQAGYYDSTITVTASDPGRWTVSATVPVCGLI